jgi:PAS domain S-box-containing protein
MLCLGLAIIVYARNRKPVLNKIFFLTILTGFFYCFTVVMMWCSPNFETAFVWHKLGTIWPLFVALLFHFALVFTKSRWLETEIHYVALYLPAFSFFLTSLMTDYITAPPVLKYWGYNDLPGQSWVYMLSVTWSAVIPLIAFGLCLNYYKKIKISVEKKRSRLVTIGLGIPIITFIITNVIAPGLSFEIPNLGIFSALFLSLFVGYAINKYELFRIDDALAAEKIIETMPDSVIISDMTGEIIRINSRLVDFTGYSEDELLGKKIVDVFPENKKDFDIILAKLSEFKVLKALETVTKNKSGEKKPIIISASIIEDKTYRPVGFTCVIHDITERKIMEEKLVKSQRLASIGELAGQIGHDLRNPLTGIKAGVFLLEKHAKDLTVEQKETLDVINRSIADANRIITSLVEYSSDFQLKIEHCTPKSLMSKALSKLQVPNQILIVNKTFDEPTLFLDAQKFENVFASIIENSIHATPETGVITIESIKKEFEIEISIEDTGTGISDDIFIKLFSPLVTTKAKGMGMSLAINKRIIEMHKGRIVAVRKPGKGTKVIITLPLTQQETENCIFSLLLNSKKSIAVSCLNRYS